VLDLARWVRGLESGGVLDSAGLAASWTPVRLNDGGTFPYGFGWMVGDQRGRLRIGHTGSWQGFRTSIQRYPEFGLTVIALANLDAALPEPITYGIAGILEPQLLPPHQLSPSGDGPPEPVEALLAAVAAGSAASRLMPGLRSFASKSVREEWGRSLGEVSRWEALGCDTVGQRRISRLGARIEHICYARATGPDSRLLAAVAYTGDWRAAALDAYPY
jgi:CubicO group peptidase (beta-lactamase class C family)